MARGAVLSQLPHEAVVTSTIAPRNYGVAAMDIFDEVRDKDQARTRDETTGRWRVKRVSRGEVG